MRAFIYQKRLKFILVIVFSGLFLSCAPLQVEEDFTESFYSTSADLEYEEVFVPRLQQIEPNIIKKEVTVINSKFSPFPIDISQKRVQHFVNYYSATTAGREDMSDRLQQSGRYFDYMSRIFYNKGLPTELVYMAMWESTFRNRTSEKKAVGYWQFIKSTARAYGLRVDREIDERKDFELSTQAAIRFLTELYTNYGDWRFVMTAYHCGEENLADEMKRLGLSKTYSPNSYWRLVSKWEKAKRYKRTREYVAIIMAMTQIALDPQKYGFDPFQYKEPLQYDKVSIHIERDIKIEELAQFLDIHNPEKIAEFKQLNPKFIRQRVPASQDPYIFRVPLI